MTDMNFAQMSSQEMAAIERQARKMQAQAIADGFHAMRVAIMALLTRRSAPRRAA